MCTILEGRVGALGKGARELPRVEAVADGEHALLCELGEALHDPPGRLARVHDHGVGGVQDEPHPARLDRAVHRARIHLELVDRPGVAQVHDQGPAEAAGDLDPGDPRLERHDARVDEVDVRLAADAQAQLARAGRPPAAEGRGQAGPALGAPPPPAADRWLGAGDAVDLGPRREALRQRSVVRREPVGRRSRARDHDGPVAEVRQVAHELRASLDPGPAHGGEVVGQHQDAVVGRRRRHRAMIGAPRA